MDKQEFVKGMTFLGIAYNKSYTKEELEVWYRFFYDIDYKRFKDGIKSVILKEKYLPSIAILRNEIIASSNPSYNLNAEDEWSNVMKLVSRYGRNGYQEAYENMDESTMYAVKQIGWTNICNSTFIQNERKRFIELFNLNKKYTNENLLKGKVINLLT